MKRIITTLLILPLSLSFAWAQQDPLPDFIDLFREHQQIKPVEKVYLHLDKSEYAQAETIWIKSYLVAGAMHEPSQLSKNLYVELLTEEGELVRRLTLKSEEGLAEASLIIPRNQAQGFYYLRAYTQWMKNQPQAYFYHKKIRILSTREEEESPREVITQKVDLQFYPEGGDLIKGLPSKLAFEVTGLNQTGNIKGEIIDERGTVVKEFMTQHEGRGFVAFAPTEDRYLARLEGIDKVFDVPTVRPFGQTMTVNNSHADLLKVNIKSTTESEEVFYFIAHTRGYVTYASETRLRGTRGFIEIDKSTIPSGISHLTLFNKYMEPIAERLVFIDQKDHLEVSINTNKQQYGNRELATVGIKVTDQEGKPVQGSFSMSVFNSDLARNDHLNYGINANLLLSSDLPGHIRNPRQYFEDSPEAQSNLDLLMMVNGWRRFSWIDIVDQPQSLFAAETGLSLDGQITRKNGTTVKDGKVFLVNANDIGNGSQFVLTDEEGRFSFTNLDYSDTTFLRFQGFQRASQKNVMVSIDTVTEPVLPLRHAYRAFELNNSLQDQEYKKYARTAIYVDSVYRRANGITYLGSVTVEADRREATNRILTSRYGPGENYMNFDDVDFEAKSGRDPYSVLLGRIAGFSLQAASANRQGLISDINRPDLQLGAAGVNPGLDSDPMFRAPRLRQGSMSSTPMVLLDNVEVPWDVIYNLQATDIDYVEVYKGGTSNMFGPRGLGGAIAFYTLKGEKYLQRYPKSGLLYTRLGGYHSAREFYAPRYDSRRRQRYIPDNRATLFWAPMITTDENGEAMISFFTPDGTASVAIDVQGLSFKGKPGTGTGTFSIRSNY